MLEGGAKRLQSCLWPTDAQRPPLDQGAFLVKILQGKWILTLQFKLILWDQGFMLLYERFKDEAEFREKFVRPLLNRLGFYNVAMQHGSQEFGKDFVFSEFHRLGGMINYVAQVKHEKTIRQGVSIDALLSQVKQSFSISFKKTDSTRECYASAVYIFNSGSITDNAKTQLLNELGRERYGDNVHFLDGERLDALNEWATLQTDSNARSRLLGLRAALRAILNELETSRIQKRNHWCRCM